MTFPEDVVFTTIAERVVIALPKDEAAELLTWLNLMDTGWLDDKPYMYFVGFKERLREQINKLPVAAVKEEKCTSHDYCIDYYNQTEAPPNS